jgi:hypothetical protein
MYSIMPILVIAISENGLNDLLNGKKIINWVKMNKQNSRVI